MTKNQTKRNQSIQKWMIILLSIFGLMVCIPVLFPQVRHIIMGFAEQVLQKQITLYHTWFNALLSLAMGGSFIILFIDYCTFTLSGRAYTSKVKIEIRDCLSEIDFHSFIKPGLQICGIYLLGILTIILANDTYRDDILWSMTGLRDWFYWSRYVIVFLSCFVQPEISMTDISPIPQLFAALILSCSSVLLVYILGNRKITFVRLLASIPLGLSPYFLECLSYKFAAPYMALSILASIIPFLFITHKKAFFFCSIISLLVMCMTYQATAGVYPMIIVILCFQYWNNHVKTNKEILSLLGLATFSFCFAMLFFKFCLMIQRENAYTSIALFSIPELIPGVLDNIKEYASIINNDLSILWKTGISLALIFFVTKSVCMSTQKKILSFFVSIAVLGVSFVLSYGLYICMINPLFSPRALLGFGVFLAIVFIWVVSDYKKIATIIVIAVNWCFFTFAFSYGNALADQARYAEFRIGILLHDLSALYPDGSKDNGLLSFQIDNSIDFTPSIKNIAGHNPVIERLVQKRLGNDYFDCRYFRLYYHFESVLNEPQVTSIDFNLLNLPVVLDSYYHTLKSDGTHVFIILKH